MENAFSVENVITSWNEVFPNTNLTVDDLKNAHTVMRAAFQMFESLGIDQDVILAPPPKESQRESLMYYLDLVPVVNITRLVNYIITHNGESEQRSTITMTNFLQPTIKTSNSILLLLYNYMLFRKLRITEVEPYERELCSKLDQVEEMKEKRNKLLDLLNAQAIEKAERSGRSKKIDHEIKQDEEERQKEKEALDNLKQEIAAEIKENIPLETLLEQKKTQTDIYILEVEKQRAMRVYNADDVRALVQKAAENFKDAEEELNTLEAKLTQKANSIKYLQPTKHNIDMANDCLAEIEMLSACLRDFENMDLESAKGDKNELTEELVELKPQLAELRAARAEAAKKRQENSATRQHDRDLMLNNLREAEEKDMNSENNTQTNQKILHFKDLTVKYEKEKVAGMDTLSNMKEDFVTQLKGFDDVLLKIVQETKQKIDIKLRKRT